MHPKQRWVVILGERFPFEPLCGHQDHDEDTSCTQNNAGWLFWVNISRFSLCVATWTSTGGHGAQNDKRY